MSSKLIMEKLHTIPEKPGVYLMYDKSNTIIYIGKAKNLKKRVSQYFLRSQSGKVAAMVFNADHYETIITQNEKEAFILEMNLIQTHYPRYNILLKDDKHYPYIAIKKKGDLILKIARNSKDKNYYYFGPFPTSSYAYSVIDLLNKIYPLRKCKNIPSSPCLYYHLGNCLAPCINEINEEKYKEMYEEITNFLSGNDDSITKKYKNLMLEASENLDFEKAKEYKDILDSISHVVERQEVESRSKTSKDVFAYSTREGYLCLTKLTYRNGILLGKDSFVVNEFGDDNELMIQLIEQYYQNHDLPTEIISNIPGINDELQSLFDVKIISPTRGENFELISMCQTNAIQGLDEHFMSARLSDDNLSLLEELGKLLNIETPYDIELFDNSHLQGSDSVGAMVHFKNGEPFKKMYRKYHIEHDEKRDDFASMKEVTYRRYSRLKEENQKFPDLLLVDGGLSQIHAAEESLKSLDVFDKIHLFGLFKNDKHQTKGLIDSKGNTYPIDSNCKLFFMLMRMQDEVHRFAISFHKSERSKSMVKSIYDGIEGLGIKRIEILKKKYPSIDDLKSATLEELCQIIPDKSANILFSKIKSLD